MSEGNLMYDACGVVTCGRIGFTETFRTIFTCAPPLKHGVRMTTSPYWDQSLTGAVKQALATGAKYLLFFDGDGVWLPEDVADLYRLIEADEKCDAVFPVQADRFGEKPLVFNWLPDHFAPGGKYNFDTPTTQYPHGHFGLTFIRSSVFRELQEPWFLSQPATDGTWDLKPGKMDADTYFWMKNRERQQRTGTYNLQANQTVIGHMELHVRWQRGTEVVIQTIPEFQRSGKPYGCRYPRPEEYAAKGQPAERDRPLDAKPLVTPQRAVRRRREVDVAYMGGGTSPTNARCEFCDSFVPANSKCRHCGGLGVIRGDDARLEVRRLESEAERA